MSNHYYAINANDEGLSDQYANWTVGTSSDSSANLEVRITDASVSRKQAAETLRALADKLDVFDPNLIAQNAFS